MSRSRNPHRNHRPQPPRQRGRQGADALRAAQAREEQRRRARRDPRTGRAQPPRPKRERPAGPAVRPSVGGPGFRLARAGWTAVPVASLGLLSFVPAAVRLAVLGRPAARAFGWLLAASLLGWVAVLAVLSGSASPALEALVLGGSALAGAVHTAATYRRTAEELAARAPDAPEGPEQRNARAVREARAVLRRREEARELAARDGRLAHELGIGAPGGEFDDGGLVDVNAATRRELETGLGLSRNEANAVLRARRQLGGRFSAAAELEVYGGLAPERMDAIAERVLIIGP